MENIEKIEAYINNPSSVKYYKKAFEKYQVAGIDQFRWNWSWWAFGGGVFYLLYRKLYLESFIYLIVFVLLSGVPFISLLVWVISGGVLPYFVYRRYKKIKEQVEENISEKSEQIAALKELGGVNKWAIWLAIVTSVLFWLFIYAIMLDFVQD